MSRILSKNTQVLIIGAGGAGLRCAIELYESGIKGILVVGDRPINDAHTKLAAGGINAALATIDKQDDPFVHAVDTFREAGGIANPNLVEKLTKHAPEAIEDLISFGAKFHTEDDGRITQRFFGAHSYRRTVFSGDETGKEMMRVLIDKVNELNIPFLENTYVFKLLHHDKKVRGALSVYNDEYLMIMAPTVIIATGGYTNLYIRSSSRNKENYGDGIALALEAGAEVGDMELVQFHPTGLVYPDKNIGDLVTEAVRAEGGVLRNSEGNRFMDKYDPDKMELSTRDVVARANYQEIRQGRGTDRGAVFLDISKRDKEYLQERLPGMYKKLQDVNGVDISKEPIEVAPTAHYSMGGINFDAETYKTSVEGLYAIGECTMGVHGANRLGGNSLAEIIVYGKLVASKLAKEGVGNFDCTLPAEFQVDAQRIIKYELEVDGEMDPTATLDELRQIMWDHAGIIRSAALLKEGLEKLSKLQAMVLEKGLKPVESKKSNAQSKYWLRHAFLLSNMILEGALMREESRGAHFREDFPEINNEFHKNFIYEQTTKGLVSSEIQTPKPSSRFQEALDEIEVTTNYVHLE